MQNPTLAITPAGPFVPPVAIPGPHRAHHEAPTLARWRVVCGNGHMPFVRFFDSEPLAESNALSHNMFVHGDEVIGGDLADVSKVFINLP